MNRLDGKVAIITGAGKGLGRAFAVDLAKHGAKTVVVTRKDLEGLKKTCEQIEALGGEALWLQVDVTRIEDLDRMVGETIKRFGKIDILINNAALIPMRKDFYEIPPEEFSQVLNINVMGAWLSTRAVFPHMKERGGKIINIASETFFTGSHGFAHYVASKGGLIGVTRALAVELGSFGICANVVAVGFTETEAAAALIGGDVKKYDTSRTPLGRLQQPRDVVGMVSFLASDEADFITGQTMLVDGGRFMH
ncbi:MAG: 3-oxoacyl-(acyl-carrier-protein) reductase FabG [Syntrophorhabdus sp. PtaU1.Bin050]|nr:MAG: 3-oxoacyl-(acyl-carrier-protein) reductase FabG [Syntrophorhabdus sp. PtaU1.Bin050]